MGLFIVAIGSNVIATRHIAKGDTERTKRVIGTPILFSLVGGIGLMEKSDIFSRTFFDFIKYGHIRRFYLVNAKHKPFIISRDRRLTRFNLTPLRDSFLSPTIPIIDKSPIFGKFLLTPSPGFIPSV